MAKKKSRAKYVSKGERQSVSKATMRLMKTEVIDDHLNKVHSWSRGENPWITIDNPNTAETRARKIRVRANDYFGDPKANKYRMGAS